MSGQHQPKGSMRMSCSNSNTACGQRDFGSMPVAQVYPDGVTALKCSRHLTSAFAKRCLSCGAQAPNEIAEGEGLPFGH